jgi:hypothetical protein
MAWDPTFDWADASSFNGEARKFSIMSELIDQLNLKGDEVDEPSLSQVVRGEAVGKVSEFTSSFDSVIAGFYDHITNDGQDWTVARLEAEIGISRPSTGSGGLLTPTWINWTYQAINLLLHIFKRSEYWTGINGNSGAWKDGSFSRRWPTSSSVNGSATVNTVLGQLELIITGTTDLEGNDEPDTGTTEYEYINMVTSTPSSDMYVIGKGYMFRYANDATGSNPSLILYGDGFTTPDYIDPGWILLGSTRALSYDSSYYSGKWTLVRDDAGAGRIDLEYYHNDILIVRYLNIQIAPRFGSPEMRILINKGTVDFGSIELFNDGSILL